MPYHAADFGGALANKLQEKVRAAEGLTLGQGMLPSESRPSNAQMLARHGKVKEQEAGRTAKKKDKK